MNKKLTKTDYIFSLILIFMLICIVASFFYGVQIGEDRAEQQYADASQNDQINEPYYTAYDQQYLASFYYTIFLPYHQFQSTWFDHIRTLQQSELTAEPDALLRELHKLADQQHDKLMKVSMPNSSPLLQEAQSAYLKSLALFSEGIDKLDWNKDVQVLLDAIIPNDEFFVQSKTYALQGQSLYYASMLRWNEQFDPHVNADVILALQDIEIKRWNELNLISKNAYIANLLHEKAIFAPYYPQDATIRVDEWIEQGQSDQLRTNQIPEILMILSSTGAIRQHDFLSGKKRYDSDEVLPQLPLFQP